MKCECLSNVNSVMICRAASSYLKSFLNILASNKFDTFSSNFYQRHVILPRQKRCNLQIDRARCCWLDLTQLRFSFPRNFSTERQIRYARGTKMHDIIFSIFFKHFWVRFLLLKSLKIFPVGKMLQLSAGHHAG